MLFNFLLVVFRCPEALLLSVDSTLQLGTKMKRTTGFIEAQ